MSDEKDFRHSGREIRDEMRIAAPAETVWRAWSDPELLKGWFVGAMEGRMEEGERVRWFWGSDEPGMSQRVVVAEPPHRLVTAMDLPQGVSYLEVTIEQKEGYSILRLVQSGFGEGPDWEDQYESMLSGWMLALSVLKLFIERYFDRGRREILVLAEAPFEGDEIQGLQRSEAGLARWLTHSGAPGEAVGQPVRLVLENGRTLTGTVLRVTATESAWSWDEMEGVVEIKAFREPRWGSRIGVRISSWMEDAAELVDLEGWLGRVVEKLVAALAEGRS